MGGSQRRRGRHVVTGQLKNGTGSEPASRFSEKHAGCEVPVPIFQHADDEPQSCLPGPREKIFLNAHRFKIARVADHRRPIARPRGASPRRRSEDRLGADDGGAPRRPRQSGRCRAARVRSDRGHDFRQSDPVRTDCVFVPTTDQIYPPGFETTVDVGSVAQPLEGVCRPGHFQGVATVVLKLFLLAQPDVAFFGRKDYQQSLVVGRLIQDFGLPIELRVCPTIREPDGLALSSRNRYLSADERQRALALSRSLALAARLVREGTLDAATIERAMRAELTAAQLAIEYVALADPETLLPLAQIDRPAVALVAARLGKTRLIDNEPITP